MYSLHRNSYLQSHSSGVNARIINRSVDLARGQPTIDDGDFEPPLNRLTSEQPTIPSINVDTTRRPLAFGKLAIPKLCRELHSYDYNVVLAAITSFVDILHNPEKGYQALSKKVPDRMTDLLLHAQPEIRERVCMALTVIAGLADGKEAIVKNTKMLTNLSLLLDDTESAVRLKAASCLEKVAQFWVAADYLIDFGFVPILLDCVVRDIEDISAIYLDTLESLLYGDEGIQQALDHDGYTTFCNVIDCEYDSLRGKSLSCLSRLLSTSTGKQIALDKNLLPVLNRIVHDERPEIYGPAVTAIMFATVMSQAKINATTIKQLPHRLAKLVHDSQYPLSQMHAIQALTNSCEHPEIRKVVSENYFEELNNLNVGKDPALKTCKNNLMKIINWLPQDG